MPKRDTALLDSPETEAKRLTALHNLGILHTSAEERFDRITAMATRLFHVPIALVSLVDENEQWFKSCIGLDKQGTPRGVSFCAHALHSRDILLIPDATLDPRFRDNPLVTGDPYIRFYAGCPIATPDGLILGTLCIIDRVSRELSETDKQNLRDMAAWVETEMISVRTMEQALETQRLQAEVNRAHLAALEQEVRKNSERFRAMSEQATDLVVIVDPKGTITYASPSHERVLGYTPEEMCDMPLSQFIHPDDGVAIGKRLAESINHHGRLDEAEFRVRHADGRWMWLQSYTNNQIDNPTIGGIIVNSRDITERRKMIENLENSEQRFQTFMDNSPVVVSIKDEDHRMVFINKQLAGLLHKDQSSVHGKLDAEIFHPDAIARTREIEEQVLSTWEGFQSIETLPAPDGDVRHWLSAKFPFQNADGTKYVGGVSLDITERILAEEQLQLLADKLERSNRELSDFASVASHDLQEPLRKVQTFADRLKSKYADKLDVEGRDYVERMQKSTSRMQLLITDLLTYSRVTTKTRPFEPVDLAVVVNEVLSDLEVRIEQTGGSVNVGYLPEITADPLQMRQLMQNLIGNALKFHKPGAPPSVRVYGRQVKAQRRLTTTGFLTSGNLLGGDLIEIVVEDDGIGFNEQYADKIFTVFQRLHGRNEYEGTGIGLAVCRRIVERHDGSISARSVEKQGSTFTVTLPIGRNDPEPAGQSLSHSARDNS